MQRRKIIGLPPLRPPTTLQCTPHSSFQTRSRAINSEKCCTGYIIPCCAAGWSLNTSLLGSGLWSTRTHFAFMYRTCHPGGGSFYHLVYVLRDSLLSSHSVCTAGISTACSRGRYCAAVDGWILSTLKSIDIANERTTSITTCLSLRTQ